MTFTRLPQGFKNKNAIFQRTLNEDFSALLYKSIIIYIDDFASYGKNFDEALKNLEDAFQIFDLMNFSLKTTNGKFFNNTIELLRHVISRNATKLIDSNTNSERH